MLSFDLLPLFLLVIGLSTSSDTLFWKHYALRIRNVGEYRPSAGMMRCSNEGLRWLPVMDEESNKRVQQYLLDNDIKEAWLGLIQSMDGRYQWMATREIATQDSYTNWAAGHPKPGYVYMDAATGKWKTEYSAATRVTLCVELERACEKNGVKMGEGDMMAVGECVTCTCSRGETSCQQDPDCEASPVLSGCEYKDEKIKEGETINIGCQHCRCVRSGRQYDLQCSSCDLVDTSTGSADETRFRIREECPPEFLDKGFRWVTCEEEGASGCDRTCEDLGNTCRRKCSARCMCPPEKPYLLHGFCKAECPGRRYSPVIVEGLANRKFPEGEQFTLKCSAIGEPVPQIKITDEVFEPDLQTADKTGQLGLRTATKVYRAIPGITPSKVTCYAWNVNGVTKSVAKLGVVEEDDKNTNPTLTSDGKIRMPPLIRLGIESLSLGDRYAQKMRCVATGSPKPEAVIVKLKDGSNTFPTIKMTAEEGVHEVLVEEIVLIDGPSAAGRYACLASNRYGATKDVATLNYIERPPTPSAAQMAMKAANFIKDSAVLEQWPFGTVEMTNSVCSYKGNSYQNGDSFKEECNRCICAAGRVSCTKKQCEGETCTDEEGNKYQQYQQWKKDCNTCTCLRQDQSFCTTKPCPESEPEPVPVPTVQCRWFGGVTYNVGDSFKHGCKTCTCHESGRPICDDSTCGGSATSCSYKGRDVPIGMRFRDDCKTCSCLDSGEISCQGSSCGEEEPVPVESGADCTYKGEGYSLFERFKDDCNMCMCLRGGTVTCTKNKCFVPARSCTFQHREVPHGTQLQVECNVCRCVDGTVTCTDKDCGLDNGVKEGCNLEGEQRKYAFGSMIQIGRKVCKCDLDSATGRTRLRERILKFICKDA